MLETLFCLAMENDIATICWLITTSRNDRSDLVGGSGRKIVTAAVTVLIKAQSDGALVFRWHVSGELKSSLVQLDSWMVAVEHVQENLHGRTMKILVVLVGHAVIETIGLIIDVELAVNRMFARFGKERAGKMGKSTMNLEDICPSTIKDICNQLASN